MICKECSEEFNPKRKDSLFCSRKCSQTFRGRKYYNEKIYFHDLKCENCGKIFSSQKKVGSCSTGCCGELRKEFLDIPKCLESASRKIDKNIGYVRVYVPMHREANTWGYVYEHRVIAEEMIGRQLKKNEIVHHKNGKRWDNRKENLEVMDKIEHSKLGRCQ